MTDIQITMEQAEAINESSTFFRLVPTIDRKIAKIKEPILFTQQNWDQQFKGYLEKLTKKPQSQNSVANLHEKIQVVQSMQAQFELFQQQVKQLKQKIKIDYDTFKFTPDMKIYFQVAGGPKNKVLQSSFKKTIQELQVKLKQGPKLSQAEQKHQNGFSNGEGDMTEEQFIEFFRQVKKDRDAPEFQALKQMRISYKGQKQLKK